MKRTFAAIALTVLLLAPNLTFAASKATFLGPIVPAECKCTDRPIVGDTTGKKITTAPDYGCVLAVVQNSVNLGVTLSTILFTIYIVIAAISFILSQSSGEALSKAKTRIMNVIIGLAVLLSAWLVVDFVMKKVYNDTGAFGPWNSILAGKNDKSDRCIVATTSGSLVTGTVSILLGNTGIPGATGSGVPSGGYVGNGLSYQPNVQKQIGYESSALGSLLACMAGKLPSGVGQISAITEQAIANGSKTMQSCEATGCAHTANSCHYGGRGCTGASYAVDFGDEKNSTAIINAAHACNPGAKYNPEGDHVHISIGAASGCSCDTGMRSTY